MMDFACNAKCSSAVEHNTRYDALLERLRSENNIHVAKSLNEQLEAMEMEGCPCSCEEDYCEPDTLAELYGEY